MLRKTSLCATAFAACAHAQVITTVAGTNFAFPPMPLPALNAPLGQLGAVAVDPKGNVYAADPQNSQVVRIAPDGTLTVVAGNGISGFTGDGGPATKASLSSPTALALDTAGNLFIADGYRIRKVSAGIITTVAGNGSFAFSGDGGPATGVGFSTSRGIAVDSAGSLYISDTNYNRVRKVSGGIITTIAGSANRGGFSGDNGPATSATFDSPQGIAVDAAGSIYIADSFNNRVRKITDGIITTVAGNGTRFPEGAGNGGPATSAPVSMPSSVAVDSAGNLFVGSSILIRKVTAGIITAVAGNGQVDFSGTNGPALGIGLGGIGGIALDPFGTLFFSDFVRLRRARNATVDTIAGNGRFRFSGDGGPATSAALDFDVTRPAGIAVDGSGTLYFADTNNDRIRRVSGGIITTLVGTGTKAFSGDGGPAASAALSSPSGLAIDSSGNLYIGDLSNLRVRKVSGGTISTVAGGGSLLGDGLPATSATVFPSGVAIDAAGNLYIAEAQGNRVRRVSGGIITTVAGTGAPGFSGDGGPAVNATFGGVFGIAVDRAGNLFIADFNNNRIRKVTGGIITTFAGTGKAGFSGDGGPAVDATIYGPYGLAIDASDNLYISDYFNQRVRRITNGIITTVAGNGNAGFSGDGGPATNAMIARAAGLAVDAAGNLFIVDVFANRVREVLKTKPTLTVPASALSFSGQSAGAPSPRQTFSVTASVPGVAIAITDDVTWLSVSPSGGATPRLVEVTADPSGLEAGTYTATIIVTAPDANPASATISVTFTVAANAPPLLALDKPALSFTFPRVGLPRIETLVVSNSGGGALNFTAAALTKAGGGWLSVAPSSGAARPGAPVALAITADPKGLAPGTYTGQVAISSDGGTQTIPVTLAVSTADQAILLSQSGLSFIAVAQGGIVAPQTFAVRNVGTGVAPFTVTTSTLPAGLRWLRTNPSSGTSDATASAPNVQVSVDATGLAPGRYYGLVRVDSPQAANSPQVLTVFLRVLAAGSDTGATAQPSELVFAARAGGESPGSQTVFLYNVTAAGKTFRSNVSADAGLTIVVLPTDSTLDPQAPKPVVIQPLTNGLGAGEYQGVVTLQFDDGRVIAVLVRAVVASAGAAGSVSGLRAGARGADGCQPTKLVPALMTLGPQFQLPAGPPVAVTANVRDDCNNPFNAGSVTVAFSNGDLPLSLQPLGDGQWETTWLSSHAASRVTLTVTASDPATKLVGTKQVIGDLLAEQDPPQFDRSGVVSSASTVSFVPLAPGGLFTIYGARLADSAESYKSTPLPTTLGNAVVVMAGQVLPLLFAGPTQINAVVPSGININTTQQVLVQRGLTYSTPASVDLAPAQPAVFLSGGLAIAVAYRSDGTTPFLVSTASPARVGDVLVLYCAGLGATTPAASDGLPAPSAATKDPVSVTIGGRSAPVAFGGLVAGFVGLYQVNTTVPEGAGVGDAVPVVLTVSGQTGAAAPLPIR